MICEPVLIISLIALSNCAEGTRTMTFTLEPSELAACLNSEVTTKPPSDSAMDAIFR